MRRRLYAANYAYFQAPVGKNHPSQCLYFKLSFPAADGWQLFTQRIIGRIPETLPSSSSRRGAFYRVSLALSSRGRNGPYIYFREGSDAQTDRYAHRNSRDFDKWNASRCPNVTWRRECRGNRAQLYASRRSRLPGMGPLVRSGLCQGLRSVSLLVSTLLVVDPRRRRAVQ